MNSTSADEDDCYKPCSSSDSNQVIQEKSGQQVRILTLNMFLRPGPINTNGNDYKEERLLAFAEAYLDKFDIICFQELFSWISSWTGRMV